MSEAHQIASGLDRIFEHRESYLVIGLTGRTGSGCTTVGELLAAANFGDMPLKAVPSPPKDHEERKYRILYNWLREHWYPFRRIHVSHIIASFILKEAQQEIAQFVADQTAGKVDLRPIVEHLRAAACELGRVEETLECPPKASEIQIQAAYRFYFDTLPRTAKLLKERLTTQQSHSNYTKLFQLFGDNVRRSGRALASEPDATKLLVLPETISQVIQVAHRANRINNVPKSYFVVDALRHPYEIRYLRERIARFFVLGVRTDEMSRTSRLQNLNLNKAEIEELDIKEYPERNESLKSPDIFVSQNIRACLELADVYISNVGTPESKELGPLGEQLLRYVSLMQHPGLVTPTKEERCMQVAFAAKVNSGCISRQVGAAVTDTNFSVKSIGWNDVPKGQVPCLLRNTAHALTRSWDPAAYSDFEKNDEAFRRHLEKSKLGKLKAEHMEGRNIAFCFRTEYNGLKNQNNQVHTRSLHAEENAFLQLAKVGGTNVESGCLFSTASPCELCAKKAYQLGIEKIFYIDPYPGISADHILASGSKRPSLTLFHGAIGRAYHDLYEPILAYKDELQAAIVPQQRVVAQRPIKAQGDLLSEPDGDRQGI